MTQRTAGRIVKACYAGGLTFTSSLSTMLVGTTPITAITAGQWTLLASWTLAAVGSVYGLAGWSGPRFNGIVPPDPPAAG